MINLHLNRPRHTSRRETQVAFYGGSFTGLPRSRQEELLQAVAPFLKNGQVDTIRLSTRPDCIDRQTVSFLKRHGVGTVELGVQSMDPAVLEIARRGHTVGDTEKAISCILNESIQVGAQLMIGLPGESTSGLLAGVRKIVALRPDFARIYPTVVLAGSSLEKLYQRGEYRPLSLLEAVAGAVKFREILENAGIPVYRTGLQHTDSLEESIVAGPYHPSFGEMVLSRGLFNKVRRVLQRTRDMRHRRLVISSRDKSLFIGKDKMNVKRLDKLGLLNGVVFEFERSQPRQCVKLITDRD